MATVRQRLSRWLGGEWEYAQGDSTRWYGVLDEVQITIAHHHRDGGDWEVEVLRDGAPWPELVAFETSLEEAVIFLLAWRCGL